MVLSIDGDELSKLLECGICLNVVCNPKQLACNHSFCRCCLDKILKFTPTGSATIKCPNGCQKETIISAAHTTNDLEINFMLKSVSEAVVRQLQQAGVECSTCKIISVKYCPRCCVFKCGECADDHDEDKDKAGLLDYFIPVDFSSISEDKGVIICGEHKCEASYLCCETKFICTYCANRSVHKKHKYEPLDQLEKSLRDQMKLKIEANLGYEKRLKEAKKEIKLVQEGLDRVVRSRKTKRLMEYKIYLDKEEQKVKKKFENIQSSYTAAFASLSYFKEHVEEDKFSILLKQNEIAKKMRTVYMRGNKVIPGVLLSLGDPTDACPLGSIVTAYCGSGSCQHFRGKFNEDLVNFVKGFAVPDMTAITLVERKLLKEERNECDDAQDDISKNNACLNDLVESGGTDNKVLMDIDQNICQQLIRKDFVLEDHIECHPETVVTFPLSSLKKTIECTFQVKNVSKFHGALRSDLVAMGKYLFSVQFDWEHEMEGAERMKYAYFYLYCSRNGDESAWSCKTEGKMTLKRRGGDVSYNFKLNFDESGYGRGYKFVKWSDLVDLANGYIVDDSLTFEITITCDF